MTRRRRYVSDAEGKRLAKLASELGLAPASVVFHPDGRVRFDSAAASRLAARGTSPTGAPTDADEALDAWEAGFGDAGDTAPTR
jgi:hypothetical protein